MQNVNKSLWLHVNTRKKKWALQEVPVSDGPDAELGEVDGCIFLHK